MLSRFRTPAEQRKTIEQLKVGTVDIVVGTHRLLASDVAFHDLGLIIVDEEQRFGVEQKEKLKKLRTNVDVLTLTATPYPKRTSATLSCTGPMTAHRVQAVSAMSIFLAKTVCLKPVQFSCKAATSRTPGPTDKGSA